MSETLESKSERIMNLRVLNWVDDTRLLHNPADPHRKPVRFPFGGKQSEAEEEAM